MKRSSRFITAIGVLAILGALAGVLAATSGGEEAGDQAAAPAGAANVLRLDPVDAEAPCGDLVAAQLYADDLIPRASPLDAGVSSGIAGFQVVVRYNPDVIRLGAGARIELGPELNTFDKDGDGVTRTFFAVQDVDDGLGRAVIGGGSIGGTGSSPNKLEEGPDPVAKGAPVLLMTITFQAVGTGEASLALSGEERDLGGTLGRSAIIDPSGEFYENPALQTGALTVAGGTCPDVPEITPRPTPGPTATYPVEPSPTPVVWNTVVAPDAPTAGRSDCPSDWVAHRDAQDRFSICYPADFSATASSNAINASSPAAGEPKQTAVIVVVSWGSRPYVSLEPNEENCALVADSLLGPTRSRGITVNLNGRSVEACLNQGRVNSIQGSTTLAGDGTETAGYIRFAVNYAGTPQASAQAVAILGTLKINTP